MFLLCKSKYCLFVIVDSCEFSFEFLFDSKCMKVTSAINELEMAVVTPDGKQLVDSFWARREGATYLL